MRGQADGAARRPYPVLVGTLRCDVPARQRSEGGTGVVARAMAFGAFEEHRLTLSLGDADGAARHPYPVLVGTIALRCPRWRFPAFRPAEF